MIEAIADLFVERVPRQVAHPALRPATSLLAVDACGKSRRIAELTEILESSAPLKASFVGFGHVNDVPPASAFDQVWLFIDAESDLAYCGLYLRELAERFNGARVRLVGVGQVDASECSVLLEEAMTGGSPPWRRRRGLVRGAALLRETLLAP